MYYVSTFTEPCACPYASTDDAADLQCSATAVLVCRFLINVQDVNKHVVLGSEHSFTTSVHPDVEAMYFAKRVDVNSQADDEVCLDITYDESSEVQHNGSRID